MKKEVFLKNKHLKSCNEVSSQQQSLNQRNNGTKQFSSYTNDIGLGSPTNKIAKMLSPASSYKKFIKAKNNLQRISSYNDIKLPLNESPTNSNRKIFHKSRQRQSSANSKTLSTLNKDYVQTAANNKQQQLMNMSLSDEKPQNKQILFDQKIQMINSKIPSFFKSKMKKTQYSISNIDFVKKLGSGKFGSVCLVRDKKTNWIMAMKIFEKKQIVANNYLQQFIRQLKIQAYLDHPSIIKLYGYFHDEKFIYVLMELGCDGELYQIMETKKQLNQQAVSYLTKSLLKSIDFMHKKHILHRDIKPQNIVLIHGDIKLCDFGWSVHKKQQQLRSTYCGTPLYLSPELLKGNNYDQKVDIWALGIMIYELHLGQTPFGIQTEEQLERIVTEQLKLPNKGVSRQFKEFIKAILQKNPMKRRSCQQLLQLPFIKQYQGFQTNQLLSSKIFK